MALWLVRCGPRGEGEHLALREEVVGIGWPRAGDLGVARTRPEVLERLRERYPEARVATVRNWAGQIHAFVSMMQVGDLVAVPLRTRRQVAFCRVTGEYRYAPDSPELMRHQRDVCWIRDNVARDDIARDLRHSLGASMTVCRIRRHDAEERIETFLDCIARSTKRPGRAEDLVRAATAPLHPAPRLVRDKRP